MPRGVYKRTKKRGRWKLTNETREKMKVSNKEKNLSRHHSEKTKIKI